MAFRSGNPTLRQGTFEKSVAQPGGATMTVSGTVHRTFALLVILTLTGSWMWGQATSGANVGPWIGGGLIVGLIAGLVCSFVPRTAPWLSPLYAAAEGVALGALSALVEVKYPGIVLQAVALTVGTLASMLIAYMTGAIRVTPAFTRGVVAATGGILLVYIGTWILGFFGIHLPFIHDNGWFGIGFSVFVVIVAALNLVLDFDFIEYGARNGAAKYMEWYGAFGLLVTLVWLYIEILRLLSKLRSR